jgi:citrate lyase subunit gamma (acyl carrier protein)
MRPGIAGTLESNDCVITVVAAEGLTIAIKSVVDAFYHDRIEKVIRQTLKERKIDKIAVTCEDKGALDYAIAARLITALARMEDPSHA